MSNAPQTYDYGHGITAVDAQYLHPGVCAIHLIEAQGKVAIIDTGNNAAVPIVIRALEGKGLRREDVAYVILTHIHLDHAGGAGLMMREFPEARLVVHPRGARHMVDPSKLVAGATEVYGAEEVQRLYGEILPIPAERIVEAHDGLVLNLADRPLLIIDTPGHARHHVCIVDERSRGVFAGDTFGISMRAFDVDGRAFSVPTTSPVQFDPQAAHASIERILSFKPSHVYVTHFGRIGDPEHVGRVLHALLDDFVALARRLRGEAERSRLMREGVRELVRSRLLEHGWQPDEQQLAQWLRLDIELNAQGLEVWLDAQAAG